MIIANNCMNSLPPDVFPVEIAHALTLAERIGLIKPPQAKKLSFL
jgi:hypothetical protein